MNVSSGPLTSAQIGREIHGIIGILSANGIDELTVYLGWGANLEMDELWQPVQIRTADLQTFVNDVMGKGIFSAGKSDLIIEDRTGTFRILVCHESDIHVTTENQKLCEQFQNRWHPAAPS